MRERAEPASLGVDERRRRPIDPWAAQPQSTQCFVLAPTRGCRSLPRSPDASDLTRVSAIGIVPPVRDSSLWTQNGDDLRESGGIGMALDERKRYRRNPSGGSKKDHRRRTLSQGRQLFAVGVAGALAAPLALTLSSGSTPAGAAASNVNPNGVLRYGFDLNNEFDNDFAPATEENDCSYTVTSNIYQSMATPGNTAVGGGVAQSWTVSNNSSHHHVPHPAGPRVLQRPAGDVRRRGGQPEPHQDQPAAVVAVRHLEHPDARSLDRGRQPQQADRRRLPLGLDLRRRPDLPGERHLDPVEPAGRCRTLRPEELSPGLVDRAGQEPQVLGLEGLSRSVASTSPR